MRALILIILLSLALPGFARFDDSECDRLINQGKMERNTVTQTNLLIKAYEVCYKNQPYSPAVAEGLQNAQAINTQAQINNIQTQQNYTNFLLLQNQINHR